MRQLMVAALAVACLLPSLAMADESAHYQVQAVPYIQAALTAPMADLGEKTQSHLAPDALDLGLALLAGRQDDKAVDTHIVMAAAQCIVAARREAGLDYKAWSTLPLSIRLLQRLPRQDIQMKVDADVAAKGKNLNYPLGAAACGTDDQFKADVIALKSLRS